MRRFQSAVLLIAFAAGLFIGAGIRFTSHYQAGYQKGRASARSEMEREAVREGHGLWVPRVPGQPGNAFAWLPVRDQYNPDATTRIPGVE